MSMPQKTFTDFRQLARFASVGVINSVIGYAVIVCALFLGAGDFLSNALGYAVGLAIGYVLNKSWAFSAKKGYREISWLSYVAVFCVAYTANLVIVASAVNLGVVENPLTHLAAMATYTAVFYLGLVAVTSKQSAAQNLSDLVQKNWPEAIVAFGMIFTLFLVINIPLSHDVVWQTWIARQILGGTELYRGILEINPPLWFWMAIPSEILAQNSALSSKQAIIVAVFAYASIALFAFRAVLSTANPLPRLAILGSTAIAMILIALPDFGQREQLALIGAIPYAALISQRVQGRQTHILIALCVALIAAPAFALKHYFVLVPVVLEIWLVVGLRTKYRPLRPETLMLAGCALLYAVAIFLFAPAFFENIVPMVRLAYHGYEVPFWVQFVRPQVFLWFVALPLFFALPGRKRPFATACLLIAIAFMLGYFLQQKGWRYHSLAATAALMLGLLAALSPPNGALMEKLKFAMAALLLVFGLQITLFAGPYKNSKQQAITALLANTPAQSTVMMISASPSTIWPMVDDMNYVWPSRHFAYWMLSAIAKDQQENGTLSDDMQVLADTIRIHAAQDLECHPPDIILVDDHSASTALDLDAINFFSENARFAEVFSHYSRVKKISRYTSYIKSDAWLPTPSSECRNVY